MTNGFKSGFGTVVFIAFFAVFVWMGWIDEGWRSFLLLVAGATFSVWAAHAITKHDEKLRGR
jgi:hypothetical protein